LAALAVLIDNVRQASGQEPSDPKLLETLLALSHDKNELLRSSAAYALGVVGSPQALARLEQMADDEVYPDALYNAATGLARHGSLKSIDVLVEMLDPGQARGIDIEKEDNARQYKRALITVNALRATDQLADANPTADLNRLTSAIDELSRADVDARIKTDAAPVLAKLKRRAAPAAVAP
jgi:HEAT repeat protein